MYRFVAVWLAISALACAGERRTTGPRPDAGIPDGEVPDASARCTPGRGTCDGRTYFVCGEDGVSREDETVCDGLCSPDAGCLPCRRGSRLCEDEVSYVCGRDQTWIRVRDCAEWGSACGVGGTCDDACGEAELDRRNVGCEYWTAPLANLPGPQGLDFDAFDYRVVVVNPSTEPASVRIRRGGRQVRSVTVAPGRLEEISLPWVDAMSGGVPVDEWTSLVTAEGAYQLTSDIPITAFQFNPFEYQSADAQRSYSNDATLLYPTHVLTGDYIGLSYLPLATSGGTIPGYLALVGTAVEETAIELTPTAPVAADAAGRWEATPTGTPVRFSLAQGEVAHVVVDHPPVCAPDREQAECSGAACVCEERDYDLSGTRIRADHPIAAFGGHVCANVPFNVGTCDHLEAQLPPLETMGTAFTGAPLTQPGSPFRNLLRVVAAFDDTRVRLEPDALLGREVTLAAGEMVEVPVAEPFAVDASEPVMVAQYLLGAGQVSPRLTQGDPSLTVLVPHAQLREDYLFITPASYNDGTGGQSYLLVSRVPGSTVRLDGVAIDASWAAVGGREVAKVAVSGGAHRLDGDAPFAAVAFGLGKDTSYAYPAGIELERIVEID